MFFIIEGKKLSIQILPLDLLHNNALFECDIFVCQEGKILAGMRNGTGGIKRNQKWIEIVVY